MSGCIKRCSECGQYTLLKVCPICNSNTRSAHPARFSPEDRYGKYRRMIKEWMK